MDQEPGAFDPVCTRPTDLARPVRGGRDGVGALSWKAAKSRYERVGRGLYVPIDRPDCVEQRIVDAAARLRPDGSRGFVTGWAALRWRGATYFDGRLPYGGEPAPVELVVHNDATMRAWPGVVARRGVIGAREVEVVDDVAVATPARALLDEIHTRGDLWSATQAVDMTAAARLISVWLFAEFLWWCHTRRGVPLARHSASLAVDESRSPRETWLRLAWVLVAGLEEPLVNVPVYTLNGRLIGIPDLFDPVAGLVGEYAGQIHRTGDRHRRDRAREERFRTHGLEYAEIVRGDSRDVAADRLRSARSRAHFLPEGRRTWTLERPDWDPAPETLDAYFERTGQVDALTACEYASTGADG